MTIRTGAVVGSLAAGKAIKAMNDGTFLGLPDRNVI